MSNGTRYLLVNYEVHLRAAFPNNYGEVPQLGVTIEVQNAFSCVITSPDEKEESEVALTRPDQIVKDS